MKTFYVTFGQKYRREPHPSGGHPDGWFEMLANDKEDAENTTISMLGYEWANISDKHPDISMYPKGCLRSVDSTKVKETRKAARGTIEPFNITISSGEDAAFMISSILRMITFDRKEYETAKECIAVLVHKLGPDAGVDKFLEVALGRKGQLVIPAFVSPLFKHAMRCVKAGLDDGKIPTDYNPNE